MGKTFTNEELDALPEHASGIYDEIETRTDPVTGFTEAIRKPVRFVVNDSDILGFVDNAGQRWMIGKNVDGFFKYRHFGF